MELTKLVPIKVWWGLALLVSILLVLAFVPRGKANGL